jgi:hypothetical protein
MRAPGWEEIRGGTRMNYVLQLIICGQEFLVGEKLEASYGRDLKQVMTYGLFPSYDKSLINKDF